MPDFAYTARNMAGERVTGRVSASSERDAVTSLSAQELFPIDVAQEKERQSRFGGRVGGQVMATTYSQMAGLLRSGVPLLRTLRVLRDQSSNATLARVLGDVHTRVEDGATLADAMGCHTRVFNEMGVSMVRAGGEGGFMEEALDRVAAFTEQYEDLKARTVGAMAYPIFLGVAGSSVVLALMIFFVPKFGELFDRLRTRGELPLMTEWLLAMSAIMRQGGLFVLIGMVVAGILVRAQLQTESGKRTRDLLKIKMPMIGSIFKAFAVSRFCRVLGTLLRNGVPILKSLDIAREAAGNRILSEAIEKASENITSGESLATPLRASGHFPSTVVEMISVAEESNTLDKVLVEIADGLEKRTTRRLDLFVRMLEPIMLTILAGCVLFVVMALLLPVIKMSGSL
ncbi:MAG: type II secretion system F family protein [Pirellulaceae bacterium]|nr:type II secretion system F family protein [Planctomycetaceae bacterium]